MHKERGIYLAHSHRWMRSKLLERAVLPPELVLVNERDEADLIIYLDPPWPDEDAPDRLRDFSPRELARTFVFSQHDAPVPWAPGMYASLRQRPSGMAGFAFTGGFYVVGHLRDPGGLGDHLAGARGLPPDLLWSFTGTGQNAPVRRRLLSLSDPQAVVADTQHFSDKVRWGWESDRREEAQRAFQWYATTLGRSKFVVCPRGRGLGSIRLFETLELGRCPVIVADGWSAPPFVDWPSCSIKVPEAHAHLIPDILRERESEAFQLGANARRAWERYFSPETQLSTLLRGCVELSERVTLGTRLGIASAALLNRSTLREFTAWANRSIPAKLSKRFA